MKRWKVYTSDKDTINPNRDNVSVRYHYSWMETAISNYLNFEPEYILDVGSGYGHWIEFYNELFPESSISGIDCNPNVIEVLSERYKDVAVFAEAKIEDLKPGKWEYNIINAVGVLHHIMSDNDLKKAIDNCYSMLNDCGILFIGTRFNRFKIQKERTRKFRTYHKWLELLKDFEIQFHRSDPQSHIIKQMDLIVCKKG